MREKGKKEFYQLEIFPICLKREFEEKIFELRTLMTLRDSSHSDGSSLSDAESEEVAKGEKQVEAKIPEMTREREDEHRRE
jgi:hypothetical protein